MLDSVSSIAALATQMSNQKLAQEVDMAVLAKAQSIQKQQGENALQLIASAAVVTPERVDVHV